MTEEFKLVTIHTDGSCLGNPGRGGYSVLLDHKGRRNELSGGYLRTTNNRMELLAAIKGLESLKEPRCVELYSDSTYLVDSVNKGWVQAWKADGWARKRKPVPNADLWRRLLREADKHDVTFKWVRGHAGNAENERCDQLANEAARQPGLRLDRGYDRSVGREELTDLGPRGGRMMTYSGTKTRPNQAYVFVPKVQQLNQ